MSASFHEANDDRVQGQKIADGPVVLNDDMQGAVPLVVHSVHLGSTVQQELGDKCVWEAADIVGVEIINWSIRVDSEMQQGEAFPSPGIQVDQVVDLLVNSALVFFTALCFGGDAHLFILCSISKTLHRKTHSMSGAFTVSFRCIICEKT